MKKLIWITSLLLLIAILPGCSGGQSEGANTVVNGASQTPAANSQSSQQQSSGESQAQMIKPEQLISKEEAVTLLGEAVKDAAKDEYPQLGLNLCFYAAEKTDSKSYLEVAVIQQGAMQSSGSSGGSEQSSQPSQSGQSSQSSQSDSSGGGGGQQLAPKDLYEGFKKIFSDPNAVVTGRIGEDTFIAAPGMSILSGEYYIYISVGNADPIQAQAIIKQAAEMAVNNLKRIQGE